MAAQRCGTTGRRVGCARRWKPTERRCEPARSARALLSAVHQNIHGEASDICPWPWRGIYRHAVRPVDCPGVREKRLQAAGGDPRNRQKRAFPDERLRMQARQGAAIDKMNSKAENGG